MGKRTGGSAHSFTLYYTIMSLATKQNMRKIQFVWVRTTLWRTFSSFFSNLHFNSLPVRPSEAIEARRLYELLSGLVKVCGYPSMKDNLFKKLCHYRRIAPDFLRLRKLAIFYSFFLILLLFLLSFLLTFRRGDQHKLSKAAMRNACEGIICDR